MAIVNSLAIGKSVKSAGNLTYKTIRGRTIASQRIVSNKSNTAAQAGQRYSFGNSSKAIKLLQQYVDSCYEKSKYGSSRNAFFKSNPKFSLGGLVGEVIEGVTTLSDGMLAALTGLASKELYSISQGSLAGFLAIRYFTVASYKYNSYTYESLKVINAPDSDTYANASYTFTFASPVKRSDLKLLAFGFSDSGLITGVGTIGSELAPTFDFGSSVFAQVTDSCTPHYDNESGMVLSVDVAVNLAEIDNCPIAIIVPSVGGKVPTINGVFAIASAV